MSLRDRLLTPPVARAITSPSGILLAGAAASAVILIGAAPLAPLAALAAWATRVAVSVPRPNRGDRIDPFVLSDPWRRFVNEALSAQARYRRAVHAADAGP